MLHIAFRWAGISIISTLATWLVVLFWWRTTQRLFTSTDVATYLIGLAAVVHMFIILLHWWISSHGSPGHIRSALSNAAAMDSTLPDANDDAAIKMPRLPILAAWATTSLASEGNEFVKRLAERSHRPIPDRALTDGQGFPVLTGRVKDLDTAAIEESLMQRPLDDMPEAKRDALVRTVSLLEDVLQQVAQDWPIHKFSILENQFPHNHTPTLIGSAGLGTAVAQTLDLRVKLFLPNALSPFERQIAQAYAEDRLSKFGISPERLPVDIVVTDDSAKALEQVNAFCIDTFSQAGSVFPQALLLLASDSLLCQTIVDDWDSQDRLFNAHVRKGLMLGEAAFGILCANEKAMEVAAIHPICYLTHATCARRDDDADGKVSHGCLSGVISTALDAANIRSDAIGTVVCDADHRTSKTLESIEAMLSQVPGLDAIENRLAVNESCGHLGAASVPGLLAAAAIQSSRANHPVLLFNVSHASERAAAVLLPANIEGSSLPQQLHTV